MALFATLLFVNDIVASIIAYCCNFCLLFCVIHNWNFKLRKLNMIIVQNIILDSLYAIFPPITGVWMSAIDGHMYIFLTGPVKHLDYLVAGYIYCGYAAVCCLCIYAFPMQFFFRYKTLVKEQNVPLCLHVGLWIFLIMVTAIVFAAVGISYELQTDIVSFNPNVAELVSTYLDISEPVPFLHGNTESTLFMGVMTLMFVPYLFAAGLIVYYNYHISTYLKGTSKLTENYRLLYQMFQRTMVIQACVFIATAVIPGVTFSTINVLHLGNTFYLFSIFASIFAWIPIINPCISMILVRPYRTSLKTKILKIGSFTLWKNVNQISHIKVLSSTTT